MRDNKTSLGSFTQQIFTERFVCAGTVLGPGDTGVNVFKIKRTHGYLDFSERTCDVTGRV